MAYTCTEYMTYSKKGAAKDSLSIPEPPLQTELHVFESVTSLPKEWNELVENSDLLMTTDYLGILEKGRPPKMSFYYVLFYQDEKVIGLSYFQHFPFSFAKSLRRYSGLRGYVRHLGARMADKWLGLKMLICGSIFLTGEHGYYFEEGIEKSLQYRLLLRAFARLRQHCTDSVKIHFLKDVLASTKEAANFFRSKAFTTVPFQPAMELNLDPAWNTLEEYLAAFSSKYRVRAKRAFKKASSLQLKELELSEIVALSPQIYSLYREVADSADFNIGYLPERYFQDCKQSFPNRFRLFGYFQDYRLVGFFTTIQNLRTLEAHFLGFEQDKNRTHQLYLNMLYQLVRIGIDCGSEKINFARTALEIKSSIGAEPTVYHSYLKHTDRLYNFIMPWFINTFESKEEWIPRHPFRKKG